MTCFACEHRIPLDKHGSHEFKLGDHWFLDVSCPISQEELQSLPGPFALDPEDVPRPVSRERG